MAELFFFGFVSTLFCCCIGQKICGNEVNEVTEVVEPLTSWLKYKKYIRKTKKINKKDICIICQEDYSTNNKGAIMYCNHTFHKSCLKTWFNERPCCPLCNTNLDTMK